MMKALIQTAGLTEKDYIVVLPMASAETDSADFYFSRSLPPGTKCTVVSFNFIQGEIPPTSKLDSLRYAKLIYIMGGDQSRFMRAIQQTSLAETLHVAYQDGATIAGTSAGAAVMSKLMITGNETKCDTAYHATFRKLWWDNIAFENGLGLLPNAIIDQHFVARSRYNRMFSALAQHPQLPCIGIDEATAIIVEGNKVTVTGESQVIVAKEPKGLQRTKNGLIKFSDVQLSVYTQGDQFTLK